MKICGFFLPLMAVVAARSNLQGRQRELDPEELFFTNSIQSQKIVEART